MKTTFNQIIDRLFALLIFVAMSQSLFSQVRIWSFDKRRAIKTQGVYSIFEPINSQSSHKKSMELFGVPAATALGMGLSFLNTALTNVTSRDEKEYSAELESVNQVSLLDTGTTQFQLKAYYVSRRTNQSVPLLTIDFDADRSESMLNLKMLNSSKLDFSPVKLQPKYKMINSMYVLHVSAVVKEVIDTNGNFIRKVIDLGKMDFNQIRIGDDCIYGCNERIASSQIPLPTLTDKGMKIEIETISLQFSAKFMNPVGTTQSDVNRFLVNYKDNNSSLIELLTTSSEIEESR